MTLKETTATLRQLLHELIQNLEKAADGNRAAAQRVRTKSITFAKMAKIFRKESIQEEKSSSKSGKKGGRPLKVRKKR